MIVGATIKNSPYKGQLAYSSIGLEALLVLVALP